MELEILNVENCRIEHPKKSLVRIDAETGLITLSAGAVESIGYKEGGRLLFAFERRSETDLYVSLSKSKDAFPVRTKKKQDGNVFRILPNNKGLALKIAGFAGGFKSALFRVSEEPIVQGGQRWHGIILANPIKRDNTTIKHIQPCKKKALKKWSK